VYTKLSYMDIPLHVVSNGRWYAMWFLMVEELFPLEFGSPEEWLRIPQTSTSIN
jgi:hypothetical protein